MWLIALFYCLERERKHLKSWEDCVIQPFISEFTTIQQCTIVFNTLLHGSDITNHTVLRITPIHIINVSCLLFRVSHYGVIINYVLQIQDFYHFFKGKNCRNKKNDTSISAVHKNAAWAWNGNVWWKEHRMNWGMGQKQGGKKKRGQKKRWGRSCFLNPKTWTWQPHYSVFE